MLSSRPTTGRVIGGLATVSVGTLCLLVLFFKWRRAQRRKQEKASTSTGVQVDALLDPALSSVTRAISDAINLDTRDPEVLNSIDVFVDAGRALLESWRSRLSPLRNRHQNRIPVTAHSRDASSNQDSAVDLFADFDMGGGAGALMPIGGSNNNYMGLGAAANNSNNNNNIDFDLISNASSDVTFLSAVEELEELDRLLMERFGEESVNYNDALKLAEQSVRDKSNEIPCRTLRTKKVGCETDEEFLAKLHLLRSGLDEYFSDSVHQNNCTVLGREIFCKIISESGGDADGFHQAYDEIMRYCKVPENLPQVKEELAVRGVSQFGFYDVVLDFVLMDALDELDETPASVHTALSSSWLPESLKKGALSAAIATAIRAKRIRMAYSDGFLSRYYCVSDYLSVPLAWAILGPACPLQEKLHSFQEMVAQFMRELFDSDYVSFDSPEDTLRTLGSIIDRYINRLCGIFGVNRDLVVHQVNLS